MDVGLKVTVTPVGWPDAPRAIDRVEASRNGGGDGGAPLPPCATETEVGEAERVKSGVAAVRQRIRSGRTVRAAPAGDQIVAGVCRIAAARAAGDVVEIGGVT